MNCNNQRKFAIDDRPNMIYGLLSPVLNKVANFVILIFLLDRRTILTKVFHVVLADLKIKIKEYNFW